LYFLKILRNAVWSYSAEGRDRKTVTCCGGAEDTTVARSLRLKGTTRLESALRCGAKKFWEGEHPYFTVCTVFPLQE